MMFKKRKAVWLLGSVILMMLVTSAFAQEISVTTVKARPGSTVKVALQGPGDGIAGINFTILFDHTILSNPTVSIEAGSLAEGFLLDQNVPSDGELRAVIYPETGNPVPTFTAGSGTICNISFDVAAGATICSESALNLVDLLPPPGDEGTPEQCGVSNASGESITSTYTFADGAIQITRPGDFNNDGSVNIVDYGMLAAGWGTTYNIVHYGQLAANWLQSCTY
jgi:hypothetical protein